MTFKKYVLAAAVMAVMSGSAMAVDAPSDTGTITFHGLVNSGTCLITMPDDFTQDGNDFDVQLETVQVADFAANTKSANSVTSTLGETPFKLHVQCDVSKNIESVSAQLDPWAGSSAGNEGILVPASNLQGAATNVALVLRNGVGGDQIKMGQANGGTATALVNGAADLNYAVAYTGPSTASSGKVQAQVAFTMDYE
ncbi:fimbrial assembly protein [Superficieibacter electus]|uniref:Fimbrial assembly protein n=1 Tax=Superficieibacter electus TaxID=2022662 RepID=A0A2P5GMJ0_9ENTR|nr:fimbrial protein [Superficieibacter electus]POP41584.1 fimbrial assembly protein [Superficieibacter electus]POP47013.1 fimbrial assembly protein [Superficieibacter electus]